MSGQATGWVLQNGPTPAGSDRHGKAYGARARGLRLVLIAVADAANADGRHAHPGVDNVASAALYSRRQTLTLLTELVAEGWLVVDRVGGGRGMATVYHLPRMGDEKGATTAPMQRETVQSAPLNGAVSPTETVQFEAETVHPRVHPNGLVTEPSNGNQQPRAVDAGFVAFWSAYPSKVAKGTAERAWPKAVRVAGSGQAIVDGAARYRDDPNRSPVFTAHPATWLNGKRWEDPPLAARERSAGARTPERISQDRGAPEGLVQL